MAVKAKYIKDLPLKENLEGTDSLILQDDEGTKRSTLEVIGDKIAEEANKRVDELEKKLVQTNTQLSEIENNVTYKKISEFGAISENLWFDVTTRRYYADENFTIQPHDNTEAFRLAVNSGFNIIIDNDYYVSDTIKIEKPIYLIGNGCYKIYTNPSPTRKSVLEVYGRCQIDSLVFESESVYPNCFYEEINGFSWTEENGYSSNLDAITLYCDGNTITNTKVINYLSMCTTDKNPNNNYNNIKNIKIDNCVLENIYIGIGVGSCDDIIIENSTFITEPTTLNDTMGHSIYLYGGVDNCIIDNCKFYINATENTAIKVMDNLSFRGITNVVRITNCYFEYIGTESANTVYSLLLDGCSRADCEFTNCELKDISCILDTVSGTSSGIVHINTCKIYSSKDILNSAIIVNNPSSEVEVHLENSFFYIDFIKETSSYVLINYDISNCTFKFNDAFFNIKKDCIIQQCKIEADTRFLISTISPIYILNSFIDTNKTNTNYQLNYGQQCTIIGSVLKGVNTNLGGNLECIGCKIVSY